MRRNDIHAADRPLKRSRSLSEDIPWARVGAGLNEVVVKHAGRVGGQNSSRLTSHPSLAFRSAIEQT